MCYLQSLRYSAYQLVGVLNASICQNIVGHNNPGHIWKFYLTEIIKKLASCVFLVWNQNPYELVEYFFSNEKSHIIIKMVRSSLLEVFLGKDVLKICSKFTREHLCRSVISIKLQSNFIEIALQHGCFPLSFLHIFRSAFCKNTSEVLLL